MRARCRRRCSVLVERAKPAPVQISIDISLSRTEGWYDGRPVAAGSTPSKLISAKSSASTNTSITRTGLLSSMKSSRHSGNRVHCPRSASSTKRLINFPIESRENHNSTTAFSHSQGQKRKTSQRANVFRCSSNKGHSAAHSSISWGASEEWVRYWWGTGLPFRNKHLNERGPVALLPFEGPAVSQSHVPNQIGELN